MDILPPPPPPKIWYHNSFVICYSKSTFTERKDSALSIFNKAYIMIATT